MSRNRPHILGHGFISLILGGLLVSVLSGCRSHRASQPATANPAPVVSAPTQTFCAFTGLEHFSWFAVTNDGQVTFLSPVVKATLPWDQLIVSWNAAAPAGSSIKIEASAIFSDYVSAFYTLGIWSPDNQKIKRRSVTGQRDDDGRVDVDTLALSHLAESVQLRLTLGRGNNGTLPALKYIGLSFADTQLPPLPRAPNLHAWGKSLAVPESSQHGYPDANGWCSPASVSMVMASWSIRELRPELVHDVPFVADKVFDDAYGGTGNWPFNTAFAGSYPGMRAYVTRLDSLAEVEDWIAAGIPVILSTRWDWLSPGRPPDSAGHLIVCIGFTDDGDVVVNDPSAHVDRGEPVQRIYKRANVIRAWTKSHNAVYLIYPENAKIPANNYGHWESR